MEDFIVDVSDHAYQTTGKLFSGDFTQIVKQNNDGGDATLEHAFYTIDDDGIVKKMGSLSFSDSASTGVCSVGLSVLNSSSGDLVPVLQVTNDGIVINGAMDVSGGTTSFETASFEVSDIDLTLGYDVTDLSLLDGGGMVLGNDSTTKKTFIYGVEDDAWLSNISLSVGTDLVLGQTGSYKGLVMTSADAGIYMGPSKEWKMSVDETTRYLKFEHYDAGTDTWVLKMELKNN